MEYGAADSGQARSIDGVSDCTGRMVARRDRGKAIHRAIRKGSIKQCTLRDRLVAAYFNGGRIEQRGQREYCREQPDKAHGDHKPPMTLSWP